MPISTNRIQRAPRRLLRRITVPTPRSQGQALRHLVHSYHGVGPSNHLLHHIRAHLHNHNTLQQVHRRLDIPTLLHHSTRNQHHTVDTQQLTNTTNPWHCKPFSVLHFVFMHCSLHSRVTHPHFLHNFFPSMVLDRYCIHTHGRFGYQVALVHYSYSR